MPITKNHEELGWKHVMNKKDILKRKKWSFFVGVEKRKKVE